MQTYELGLTVRELGDYVPITVWQNTVPCPCTATTGDYSPDWHRDNPSAGDCGGRGFVGGTLQQVNVFCVYQPAFLAVSTLRDFVTIAEIGELNETDVILFSATYEDGSHVVWSTIGTVEAVIFDKTYRILRILPSPVSEIAIFRQVA